MIPGLKLDRVEEDAVAAHAATPADALKPLETLVSDRITHPWSLGSLLALMPG